MHSGQYAYGAHGMPPPMMPGYQTPYGAPPGYPGQYPMHFVDPAHAHYAAMQCHPMPQPFPEAAKQTYDAETEKALDKWVEAKRAKDFETADSIRASLREKGIDPESVRPASGSGVSQAPAVAKFDPATEAQLDSWVAAKRDKDWQTADEIRKDLRSRGIDPDTVRPALFGDGKVPAGMPPPYFTSMTGSGQPTQASRRYDEATERELDRWVMAKRERDFATADRIRSDLRARGIEPDLSRPSEKELLSAPIVPASPVMMQRFDAETEKQLDRWVAAKREKDFVLADNIRTELRSRGIEPDAARPTDGKGMPLMHPQPMMPQPMHYPPPMMPMHPMHPMPPMPGMQVHPFVGYAPSAASTAGGYGDMGGHRSSGSGTATESRKEKEKDRDRDRDRRKDRNRDRRRDRSKKRKRDRRRDQTSSSDSESTSVSQSSSDSDSSNKKKQKRKKKKRKKSSN